MLAIRRTLFFIHQYSKQLKKKWATLLLLFLFPIILVGLSLGLIASLFIQTDDVAIRVALVDEDQTKESQLFSAILEGMGTDSEIIQISLMSKDNAEQLIKQNELSAYFLFPQNFTSDLYVGKSVIIPIVGNAARPTESFVVKEIVDSLARLLATAQANILTINDYAKELDMSEEDRMEFMFQQFMDFTIYTLGKDKMLDEEVILNIATSSPNHYYILTGWYILFSIWLLSFYIVLGKEEHVSMLIRMKLFGVTIWQRIIARLLVSLIGSLIFAAIVFFVIQMSIQYDLYFVDFFRVGLFTFLYGLLLLISLAIVDCWITSQKLVLVIQCCVTFILVVLSGAIIPTLYFPQFIQPLLTYSFSYDSLNWMIDIVLEERNYADFKKLAFTSCVGLLVLRLSTICRERWLR